MSRERRVGIMGSTPFGAGYLREIERRRKSLKAAIKGKEGAKQMRLPRF